MSVGLSIAARAGGTRRIAFVLLGLATSAAAIAVLVNAFDFGQVVRALERANPAIAFVAVLTLGCSIAVRTARWKVLLVTARETVRMPVLARVVLIGYLGNSVAPLRFGDLLRVGIAARLFRLPTLEAAGSVIAERLIDTAALAVVVVIAVLALQGPAWLVSTAAVVATASALAIVSAHLALPIAERLSARLHKEGLLASARIHARRLLRAVRATPSRSAAAAGLSLLAWIIDGLTFWLCAQSLGLEVSWPIAMVVAGTAALGMAAPSGPAAIGTFELAGSAAGVALGMSGENALALAVFGHALTVIPLILAGGLSLALVQHGSEAGRRGGGIHVVDGADVQP